MAKDIVDVAIGEIGYKETGNNRTKYGAWFGMNGASWCHMFVSWCANQAGIASDIVPKTASTSTGMAWFKQKGLFKYKGKYTPKRGDIIYFKSAGASHVGIVEKASGNKVYTIEGNTSNKVARREYLLNAAKITGYGVPNYTVLNSSDKNAAGTSKSKKKKNSETELKYLRKVLEKKKVSSVKIAGSIKETNKLPEGRVTVIITTRSGKQFDISVKDGLSVIWERKGTPGKATFEAMYDKKHKIVEGNSVLICVDGAKFFYGFVFSKQESKDGMISYTVYDQLRYLKNKDTMIYKQKRADQVIKTIADKFNLECGTLTNTVHRMSAVEDDITLFDIIQNSLDETLMVKGKVYVLYDDVGKLKLTNVSKMKVNTCLVDEETGENYTYKTTIDDNVYNQIKLIYENKKKGTYDLYITKHSKNINKWGVLQYTEKIDTPDVGKLKAEALLKLYNQKQRSLTVSRVIGNRNVRGGSLVPVLLKLSDITVANYMLVEKVTHYFSNRQHTMDLILSGGDFSD